MAGVGSTQGWGGEHSWWGWGAPMAGVGSTHGRAGEHTHPVTPHRPGSIAQNEGLQKESKPQALDLGKTTTDKSSKTAKPKSGN